jgi:hypothetical protein
MPSTEVNSLLLKAISDENLRPELLKSPADAAKKAGLSAEAVTEVSKISLASLHSQFDRISSIAKDLGGALEAGYSRDFNDGNVHNKDDHTHDKMGHAAFADPLINVANPAIDKTTLTAALKDPVVLREFQGNERLRGLAKTVLGKEI